MRGGIFFTKFENVSRYLICKKIFNMMRKYNLQCHYDMCHANDKLKYNKETQCEAAQLTLSDAFKFSSTSMLWWHGLINFIMENSLSQTYIGPNILKTPAARWCNFSFSSLFHQFLYKLFNINEKVDHKYRLFILTISIFMLILNTYTLLTVLRHGILCFFINLLLLCIKDWHNFRGDIT